MFCKLKSNTIFRTAFDRVCADNSNKLFNCSLIELKGHGNLNIHPNTQG